jgi:hypothetical protein
MDATMQSRQNFDDMSRNAEQAKQQALKILIEEETEAVLAEFSNPAELLHAAELVHKAGYDRYEVYSPFPIHGMDDAMGLRQSPLGYLVFGVGFTGFLFAIWMQWWMGAVDYPLVFSGKPFFSIPPSVPIMFELMVLSSAFTAIIGMFYMNKMPRFFHPIFHSDHFAKATDDGFFLAIFAWDKKFDVRQTKAYLESIGGKNIELVHRPIEEEEIEEVMNEVSSKSLEAVK